jgi:hypothetical protein
MVHSIYYRGLVFHAWRCFTKHWTFLWIFDQFYLQAFCLSAGKRNHRDVPYIFDKHGFLFFIVAAKNFWNLNVRNHFPADMRNSLVSLHLLQSFAIGKNNINTHSYLPRISG